MSELADFIRARLQEDEEVATKAAELHGSEWFDDDGMVESAKLPPGHEPYHLDMYASEGMWAFWDCEGAGSLQTTAEASAQFARWDPKRVLSQVRCLRELVDDLDGVQGEAYAEEVAQRALKWIARPFADHPTYREEWRPEG